SSLERDRIGACLDFSRNASPDHNRVKYPAWLAAAVQAKQIVCARLNPFYFQRAISSPTDELFRCATLRYIDFGSFRRVNLPPKGGAPSRLSWDRIRSRLDFPGDCIGQHSVHKC